MAIEYKHAVLANGLKILAEVDSAAHTSAFGYFVKTGSRDETADIMGVSHFLEHMMFKGTETRTADDVNRELDELGSEFNAFTSHEMTAFWAHLLPEYLDKGIEIFADIMRPSLREDDMNTERSVILEEIAMYHDIPFWRLYDATMKVYYGDHPLSHRVLGTNDTVAALTNEAMTEYFNRRYSADNTTFVMAGQLDFASVVADVDKLCGKWPRTNTRRTVLPYQSDPEEVKLEDDKTNKHYLLAMAPAPSIQEDMRYAADILTHLIGDPEGSLLYWALVDPGIAEEAQIGYESRDGFGEYYAYASCPPARAEEVEKIIFDRIKRCMELITQDDLERLQNKIATIVTLHGERPAGRMRRLGRIGAYDLEYKTLDEELAKIQSITLADICEVFEAYPFEPCTIGRLCHK